MNNLDFANSKTMSSLEIAEVIEKPHSDVLKAICKMEGVWVKLWQGKFSLSSYVNQQNKTQPCYVLTKTECLYVATKFKDEARARLVLRWEELEKQQQVQPNATTATRIQALLQSVQLMAELEQRQMQNEQRTLNLENRPDRMEQKRIEDTERLLEAPLSEDVVPETSLRNTIRKLVNQYSNATGINQQDVWHSIYSDLYYKYGKSIKSYKKEKARDTNLDIAERNGLIPMMHAIISSKVQCLK